MKKFYVGFIIFFFLLTIFLLYFRVFQNSPYYEKSYQEKTNIYVTSLSRPRGRILDIHGHVLVDNVGVRAIVYRKVNQVSTEEEISIALELAELLTFKEQVRENDLKKFWLVTHEEEAQNLITEEEYDLYEKRKLNSEDLYALKLDRVTKEVIDSYDEKDETAAYIYSLMNKGYYYDAKLIKLDVSEEEYAHTLEAKIQGITGEMYFKRDYPYGNTLKSIFGSVGKIPKEMEQEYKENGYSMEDIVGISYLEKEYEEFLRGEKDTYKVMEDGTLMLVSQGKRGNDLVLSIDIEMQLAIEQIVKEKILEGKQLKNTEYYHGSYVIVGNPSNGSIYSIVGLKLIKEDVFKNVESDVLNLSFTAGSIVKGASMAMAYQQNLVEVGKKIKDSCVKLYLVPEKCSYKSLGYVDDITALKTSSNYYQFLLAIKLAGYSYKPNLKMQVSEKEFTIYRDAFASFGLGVKTGIDLPDEQTGIKGSKIAPDLLLNFAIGQYDTYTPLALLQYINTLYNDGVRYSLSLMDKIVDNEGNTILENPHNVLSTFSLEETYFERIKKGFYEVINGGTGSGYVDPAFNAAGKTGTSETIYDSDGDGVGDVATINNTFAMYAPFDQAKYSMVAVSPSVSHYNGITNYFAYINRYISKAVSDYLLEKV